MMKGKIMGKKTRSILWLFLWICFSMMGKTYLSSFGIESKSNLHNESLVRENQEDFQNQENMDNLKKKDRLEEKNFNNQLLCFEKGSVELFLSYLIEDAFQMEKIDEEFIKNYDMVIQLIESVQSLKSYDDIKKELSNARLSLNTQEELSKVISFEDKNLAVFNFINIFEKIINIIKNSNDCDLKTKNCLNFANKKEQDRKSISLFLQENEKRRDLSFVKHRALERIYQLKSRLLQDNTEDFTKISQIYYKKLKQMELEVKAFKYNPKKKNRYNINLQKLEKIVFIFSHWQEDKDSIICYFFFVDFYQIGYQNSLILFHPKKKYLINIQHSSLT